MPLKLGNEWLWPTRQFMAGSVTGIAIGVGSFAMSEAAGSYRRDRLVPVVATAVVVAAVATGYGRRDQLQPRADHSIDQFPA